MSSTAIWRVSVVLLTLCCVGNAWGETVDPILEWNAIALQANAFDHTGPELPGDALSESQGPPASARVLAIVHVAMFDAYNAIDRRYTPYSRGLPQIRNASIDAAVAKAAHDTLLRLIPSGAPIYRDGLRESLSRVEDRRSKITGLIVGTVAAHRILHDRREDAEFLGGTYLPTGEIGIHDVDPNNPGQSFIGPDVGLLPPFAVPDITLYRAPPPPAIDSLEYAMAFEEVRTLGVFRGGTDGEVVPTDDETYVIANYWSYNGSPLIGTPPRLYNQIVRVIAQQQNNEVHENARLFALVNLAMADGGISAWDSKYAYDYWRPVIGIRRADQDGNDWTVADPFWSPLGGSRSNPFVPGESNFTPPFPAYTSGHATFGAAALKIVANFYQSDEVPFTFISDEWNGTTVDQFGRRRPLIVRHYSSLSQAVAENAASRVFNGVHWRYDGTEGVRAGNAIADYVFDHLLRPRRGGTHSIPDAPFEQQIDDILAAAQF